MAPKSKRGPKVYFENAAGGLTNTTDSGPPSPSTPGSSQSDTTSVPNLTFDDIDGSDVIPLKSPAIHKFYEPVVLLKALNFAARDTAVSVNQEASIDTKDDIELFKAFVYKLGHVCASAKGGPTITAFCVLQKEEGLVNYWFASNQRTTEQLQATKEHIQGILDKVKDSIQDAKLAKNLFSALLVDVLVFNRPRIANYIENIKIHGKKCKGQDKDAKNAENAENPENPENANIADTLNALIEDADFDAGGTSKQNFVWKCAKLLSRLEEIKLSSPGIEIAKRAREARKVLGAPSKDCWSDLQHAASRLLAYAQSVRFILKAKEKWPQLFENFEISYCKSSEQMPRPGRQKSNGADGIVNRMTRKVEIQAAFKDFVRDLQAFDLDAAVKKEYQNKRFLPIVHAEVLLLDQLNKQGLLEPRFFFNRCMYIGSSKPTCKLCNYYFETYHVQVGHRSTHGNIYPAWRFPDLLTCQGEVGAENSETMFYKVLGKVRDDAFDVIKKKTPSSYRGKDSFTISATLPGSKRSKRGSVLGHGDLATIAQEVDDLTTVPNEVDDLASTMGQLDLDSD